MNLIEFVVLVIIAGVAGAIAQALTGAGSGGFLVSIVLGFLGAYVGIWIARNLSLPQFFTIHLSGRSFPVVWAIIGAVVVLLVLKLISRA